MNDQERKELVEYRVNRAKATLAEVDLHVKRCPSNVWIAFYQEWVD